MNFNMRRAAVLLTAIGLTLLSGTAAATNGYFTHGVGTESKGMAGTGVGSSAATGPIVVASNPALGVFASDSWEVGLSAFSPRRSYEASASLVNGNFGAFTIGEGSFDSSSEWFPIPYIAKNWHLDNDMALTFIFYGRGGMNTDWDHSDMSAWFDPGTGAGQFDGTFGGGAFGVADAGVDLSQAFLALNLAGKSGDKFAWGIGPVFAIQMFEATGTAAFMPYTETFNECFFFQAPGSCDPTPSSLSNNGHDSSAGFGAAAGIWWSMGNAVSAGLSYQSKMSMSEFKDYSDLFAEAGGFDIPASTKFGISFQGSNNVRLNIDIEHTEYSDVPSVGNPMSNLFSCPYAVYGGVLQATGSQAAALAAAQASPLENCLGGNNGGGFGWDDMTTFKFGVEWTADEMTTWRFGYSYGEQPIQEEDITFNILAPGVMEQHITFGLTKGKPDGGAWNFSLMYAPSKSIEAVNPFDPTQTIELEMSQFEFEVSYLW
jgi:long-chain fatty acid transport protein